MGIRKYRIAKMNMINSTKNIEDKLNSCALIIRKYNLGDKYFFFSKFPNTNKTILEAAWNFGLQKIQNREIIKDASARPAVTLLLTLLLRCWPRNARRRCRLLGKAPEIGRAHV